MVAAHHARALMRISPSSAISTSVPGERPADGSEPVCARAVEERRGGRLRQAVALENLDADRVEPLRDVVVERGRAGDEEAQPAAEAFPDGREDELVGELVLHRIQRRRRSSGLAGLRHPQPDTDRPVEDLLLGAALFLHHSVDAGVGLLEDPRRGTHERRPNHREVLDDLVDAAVHDGREPDLDRTESSTLPKT